MRRRQRLIPLALATLALAGCAQPVRTTVAPNATEVACSTVLVNLPESLGDRERREVTAQSTAAWSSGADDKSDAVVLRCGVDPPGPTTDPCTTVGGVDWMVDEQPGQIRYRTYGRVPAVELLVPVDNQVGVDVMLASVSHAVEGLEAIRECS